MVWVNYASNYVHNIECYLEIIQKLFRNFKNSEKLMIKQHI